MKLLNPFYVFLRYLKDVESTEYDFNDWYIGIEMIKLDKGRRYTPNGYNSAVSKGVDGDFVVVHDYRIKLL